MTWLKVSDTGATHPQVMALATAPAADDRTINEVFGFVIRCAVYSAGQMTDYRIDAGIAAMFGGPNWKKLVRQAIATGLFTEHGTGRSRYWVLIEDSDQLFHVRRKAEVDFDRQRRRDSSNKKLTSAVRLRDGDACRYCGHVVDWSDRKGNRSGTYDHREPGKPARMDTYVVACRSCNSSRKDDPNADQWMPLRPAPEDPYYSPSTIAWLASRDVAIAELSPPHPPGSAEAEECDTGRRASTPHRHTDATAPGAVEQQQRTQGERAHARPSSGRNAALQERTGGPAPGDAEPTRGTSERTGGPAPGDASPIWGNGPPGRPPDWAAPDDEPDLQIPADSSRSEGCGPGRDGPGRVGTGAAMPAGRGGDLSGLPSREASSHSAQRYRRGGRGRR